MFDRLRGYYQRCSIREKINISVIGAAGIILVLIMSIVLFRTQRIVADDAEEHATAIGKENAAWTCDYLDEKFGTLKGVAQSFESLADMGTFRFGSYKKVVDRIAKEDTVAYAMWYIEDAKGMDSSSVVKYIAGAGIGENQLQLLSLVENKAGYLDVRKDGRMVISDPISVNGAKVIGVTVPIKGNGAVIGAVGFLLKEELFSRIVREAMDSKDVACKIISNSGCIVAHPSKEVVGTKLNEGEQTDEILDAIRNSRVHTSFSYSATFGEEAYKVYAPTDFSGTKSNWSFCTMVPKSAFTHTSKVVALLIFVLMLVGLALLAVITNTIARAISNPIVRTSNELKLISEGRLAEAQEIIVHTKDEIGVMVNDLNELSSNLKHLAHFALEVGTGNLDAAIKEKSEHDVIGKSMVEMKQNLIAARDAEVERKRIDEIQSWKVEGNARIHETIRKENTSIKQLCDAFLQEIIGYTKAIQGGIFIINDDQESERYVELVSCVAYSRKKMLNKRMSLDEGMIGRCIYEKAPIILTEIPQDYLSITSGLGDRRPDFLAIIPLVNNDEVVGAIEVASFTRMEQHVLEYLGKAAESLASAIANVKINERTQRLLDQTKMFAEEMAAQEEELRQNMEEMQAAQEEMHRKTEEYEDTIRALKDQLGIN